MIPECNDCTWCGVLAKSLELNVRLRKQTLEQAGFNVTDKKIPAIREKINILLNLN